MSAIADYQQEWKALSNQHEELLEDISKAVGKFAGGESLELYSFAVVGVFGSGKTQLLYHITQLCIDEGILPMYFEADYLFEDVFEMDSPAPKDVNAVVEEQVEEVKEAVSQNDVDRVSSILNPSGDRDQEQMVERIMDEFGGTDVSEHAVLVDELEQQYGELQDHVRAEQNKNSPLRDWLEGKNSLKFLALAPAGIYEMGGADQTRCKRLVIPPADVMYIREKLFSGDTGAANACWWLSRGNPRHIIKNIEEVNDAQSLTDPVKIQRFLESLDQVGQEPSRVPAVSIKSGNIDPEDYEHLLDLRPKDADEQKRFVIDVTGVDKSDFIEEVEETFEIDRITATYVAEYFFFVVSALSDEEDRAYFLQDEITDLFAISFDFLLEYQHNNPDIEGSLRGLTETYSDVQEGEIALMLGEICEYKKTEKGLPLSLPTLRELFPLPIVDPLVRGNSPSDVNNEHEGRGLPIWEMERQGQTIYVFLSQRDFEAYTNTDAFENAVIPDGKGALCLICEEIDSLDDDTLEWHQNHEKLNLVEMPPLLADFLASVAGETVSNLPGDLESSLDSLVNGEDPILSRKVKIYRESLLNTIDDELPAPDMFCTRDPKNTNVWGGDQISDREIVIPALAIAFRDLDSTDLKLLNKLLELFESDGPLTFIAKNRSGYPTIARDMLPQESPQGGYEHQNVIKNAQGYFDGESALRQFAQMVSKDTFRKLTENENKDRLLTALWQAQRNEFDIDNFDGNLTWLKNEVVNTLEDAEDLETEAVSLGIGGIDWEDNEQYVSAYSNGNLDTLKSNTESANEDGDDVVKKLYELYLSAAREDNTQLTRFSSTIDDAERELNNLQQVIDNLENNVVDCAKARQFVDTDEDEVEEIVADNKPTGTIDISNFDSVVSSSKNEIQSYSTDLNSLEDNLNTLEEEFEKISEIRTEARGDSE